MKSLPLVVMLLITGVIAACTTQPPLVATCGTRMTGDRSGRPALIGNEYGLQTTPIPLNSVQFSNAATSRSVSLQHLYSSRLPANTTQVVARFVSCLDKESSIRVRTSFLGEDASPVESTSAWQTIYLHPHLVSTYTERSTSREAVSYLIEVAGE